jgi:hypothetical protein
MTPAEMVDRWDRLKTLLLDRGYTAADIADGIGLRSDRAITHLRTDLLRGRPGADGLLRKVIAWAIPVIEASPVEHRSFTLGQHIRAERARQSSAEHTKGKEG